MRHKELMVNTVGQEGYKAGPVTLSVIIPLAQAGLLGACAVLIIGAMGMVALRFGLNLAAQDVATVALVGGVGVFCWHLWQRMRYELYRPMWAVEEALDVDIDRNGVVGEPEPEPDREAMRAMLQERIRLVPYKGPARLVDGVAEEDLCYFIDRLSTRGWSQRSWMGRRLPSGKVITTFEDYDTLVQPLVKAGVIVDREERKSGDLAVTDPHVIKRILGLPPTPLPH